MSSDPNKLQKVVRELAALELIFHQPEYGTSRGDYDRMIADEFREVGASGKKYSRDIVLDTLEQRLTSPVSKQWTMTDLDCRCIAAGIYLLTYQLEQDGGRLTRRSTLWQSFEDGWKALYHQGTLITQSWSGRN